MSFTFLEMKKDSAIINLMETANSIIGTVFVSDNLGIKFSESL